MKLRDYNLPLLIVLCSLFIVTCASTPTTPDDLDLAIRDASDYLNDNIPAGSKIVILNIQSDSAALSDYIIDELIANAVNDRIFSVVNRAQLDLIRAEQNFQFSGEVSDETALSIGNFLGAQIIVSGRVSQIGDRYRFTIRALEVQTARVVGQNNMNIAAGATITALMRSGATVGGNGSSSTATASGSRTQTTSGSATTPTYKIGDTGPAGGLIFYDKGNRIGGWRYLEAAPADIGYKRFSNGSPFEYPDPLGQDVRWGRVEVTSVGKGKQNTEAFMDVLNQIGGGFGWVIRDVTEFEINGFDDWFLPSRDELNFMYGNLYLKELGNFRSGPYWTSSIAGDGQGYARNIVAIDFSTGRAVEFSIPRDSTPGGVRPIRQF
jgi:TolB-like protein